MSAWLSQQRRLSVSRLGLASSSGPDLLLAPFLGVALLVRVLTDNLASPESRQSGSFDISGGIAVLFILLAVVLLLRRRHGSRPTVMAALWLSIWTAIALHTHGVSTETFREGVREGSVLALAVIVYNARGAVPAPTAARLVQLAGFVPALLALYQLATHTGADIHGNLRSNGTFVHPDSAAMFFAIAATTSLWLYLDNGRRRLDALLVSLFAAALIATLSLAGLAALLSMLVAYGALRHGTLHSKLGPWLVAGLVLVGFLATPLGAGRIGKETSTNIATAERGEPNTSLAWRLHKWKMLLPGWERSPFFGQGLGTTTTTKAIAGDRFTGKPPHNEYVRYLVETGVVGLTILFGAVAVLIRNLQRRRQRYVTISVEIGNTPTLAILITVGCLVNSLADNTLLNSPTCYAAALVVAAVLSLSEADTRLGATAPSVG